MDFFEKAKSTVESVKEATENAVEISKNNIESLNISDKIQQTKEGIKSEFRNHSYDISENDILESEIIKDAISKVDEMVRTGKITDSLISVNEELNNLTEVCKGYAESVSFAATSYYTACKYVLTEALDAIDQKIVNNDVEPVLIESLNTYYSNESIIDLSSEPEANRQNFIEQIVDETLDVGKAIVYIEAKFALGTVKIFDNAFKAVYGSVEYLLGNPEKAKIIVTNDSLDEFSDVIDEQFSESDLIPQIGNVAEDLGGIATKIGLSIVALGGITALPEIAVPLAFAALSLDAAGEDLTRNVNETESFEAKELLSAIVTAGVTRLCYTMIPVISNGVLGKTPKIAKAVAQLEDLNSVSGGRIVGTLTHLGIGAATSGLFVAADEVRTFTRNILGIEENFNIKEEILKSVSTLIIGTSVSGLGYYSGNVIKNSSVLKFIVEKITGKEYIPAKDSFLKEFEIEKMRYDLKASDAQMEIYKDANLTKKEVEITNSSTGETVTKEAYTKEIDLDYVDPKTGMTNRELMSKGRSPIDPTTGEKIELHHANQDFDGDYVELLENSEHGDGNHSTLHPETNNSWRQDPQKVAQYNAEKKAYWQSRLKALEAAA